MMRNLKRRVLAALMTIIMVFSCAFVCPFDMKAQAAGNEKNVTLHFYNIYGWTTPALQYWQTESAVVTGDGEEVDIPGWTGDRCTKLLNEGDGWYKITLKGNFEGFQFLNYPGENGKVGDDNSFGKGYVDSMSYCTGDTPKDLYCKGDDCEKWFLDKECTKSIETLSADQNTSDTTDQNTSDTTDQNKPDFTEQTVTVHYKNTNNWSFVNGYVMRGTGNWSKLENYDFAGDWPGVPVVADSANEGYYTFTVTMPVDELHVIFNNVVNNGDPQTNNININPTSQVSEYWVSGDGSDLTTTAPEGWNSSEKNELKRPDNGGQGDAGDIEAEPKYTYNVYYFDANEEHMSTTAADIWSWSEPGATLLNGAIPFTSVVTLEDGNKWLKAEIKTDAGKVGLIPRSVGEWKWKTADHFATIPEGSTSMDVYIVFGDDANTYTSLPTLKEQRKRYVLVDYNRPNNDYEGWNIYSWNTGLASETNIPAKDLEGDR
ncbi:MAG: starch-binding protein, partial [Veillonella sp.]|nr:starch-binding protein [Veillonella sp.]